jgi:threonine dehydratase
VPTSTEILMLPTFDDVKRAAARLSGVAHRTPVVTSRTVDRRCGASVFFKCENLQRCGAFKFRGAYNALAGLDEPQRRRGVVTFSSGNHAQAIALAGQLLECPRVVVMPSDAPAVKRNATMSYGADIVLYDREIESRETIGGRLADERGLAVIPPYDHEDIVAGAGTAAYELFEDVGQLDLLVVPCGGGGLLSGSILSSEALSPGCRVIGVEPLTGDDATRSFHLKSLQTADNPQTVADGARTVSLGRITFAIVTARASDMVTVDDPALLRSMFFLWERLKLVVEPTGALGAAAVFDGRMNVRGLRVGVILSGGNVDFSLVGEWRSLL